MSVNETKQYEFVLMTYLFVEISEHGYNTDFTGVAEAQTTAN